MNSILRGLGLLNDGDSKVKRKPLSSLVNDRIPVPDISQEDNTGNFEEEEFTDFDAQTLGSCTARSEGKGTFEEEEKYLSIKIGDEENPQDVVAYENICYAQMIKRESQYPKCVITDLDICGNDRKLLFDELTRIHYKCLMATNTLYCAFGIIDRAINLIQIANSDFKSFGIAALFIATKMEDIIHTQLSSLLEVVGDPTVTRENVINAEIIISNTLRFDFSFPTPMFFLDYYLRIINKTYEQMLIARYVMELCITSEEFVDTKPSALAATAVSITLMITSGCIWTNELAAFSKYTVESLATTIKQARNIIALECTKRYYPVRTEEQQPKHMFVYYKYKSSPFHSVSKKIGLGP